MRISYWSSDVCSSDLFVGIVSDITERKHDQEREQLRTREVDHRARNLLAIINSVVQLTQAASTDEFIAAVSGRIQALARAHTLLADSRWEGAELTILVREELAPFGPEGERDRKRTRLNSSH